jgi:uncharacterized protein
VSALDLVIASIVIAFGAAVQGGVGFGINVIAAPILAVLDPDLVPGPGLAVGFFLTLLVAVRDRAALDRRGLEFNIAGRVPGTLLGAAFIASIPKSAVTITVGCAVLLAVVLNLVRVALRPTPRTLVAAGVVSGFASTVSSVGGPPTAIVYANEPAPVARATLAFIFLIGSLMSLVALAFVGEFGVEEMRLTLLLLVPAAVGFVLSKPIAAHVDRGTARHAILIVAALGALTALAKELL